MTAPDPRPGGCLSASSPHDYRRMNGTPDVCAAMIGEYAPRVAERIAADAAAAARAEGRAERRGFYEEGVKDGRADVEAIARVTPCACSAQRARAEAAERRLAEVEGKVRAVGRELQGLVSRYTRAPGENGDRVADLLSEDAYRIGSELLAALSDPAPEADAPVPQRDADPAPADERAIRERVAREIEAAEPPDGITDTLTRLGWRAGADSAARIAREGGDRS